MTYIVDFQGKGVRKELAQGLAAASATSVYTCPANKEVVITSIMVCNTSNASRWFSIWIDRDGTTYNNTTKLFHELSVSGNTTVNIVGGGNGVAFMNNSAGNIATQAQNANDITITIFGIEYDIS